MTPEEVVSGVTNLQISYGVTDSDIIGDATTLVGAAAWGPVNSVFIALTVLSTDQRVTTDGTVNDGRIERTFNYVITLRNRAL